MSASPNPVPPPRKRIALPKGFRPWSTRQMKPVVTDARTAGMTLGPRGESSTSSAPRNTVNTAPTVPCARRCADSEGVPTFLDRSDASARASNDSSFWDAELISAAASAAAFAAADAAPATSFMTAMSSSGSSPVC
eukprot:scaffold34_cov260-Pinguiococcus_pyrenoidosus.AAC.27